MKATVYLKDAKTALKNCSILTANKTVIAATQNVVISFYKEKILFRTNNLYSEIYQEIPIKDSNNLTDTTIVVPCQVLLSLLFSLKEEYVDFKISNKKKELVIESQKGKHKIKTYPKEEIIDPICNELKTEYLEIINYELFLSDLKTSSVFVEKDDTRPALNCCQIIIKEDELLMNGFSSFAGVSIKEKIKNTFSLSSEILITKDVLNKILSLEVNSSISIYQALNKEDIFELKTGFGGFRFKSQKSPNLIYPDVSKVLKIGNNSLFLPIEDAKDSIRRVKNFSVEEADKAEDIFLEVDKEFSNVCFSATSYLGESFENVKIKSFNKNQDMIKSLKASFHKNKLEEMFNTFIGETVEINFNPLNESESFLTKGIVFFCELKSNSGEVLSKRTSILMPLMPNR